MRVLALCAVFCAIMPVFAYAADANMDCTDLSAIPGATVDKSDPNVQKATLSDRSKFIIPRIVLGSSEEIQINGSKLQVTSRCGPKGTTGTITVCVQSPKGQVCGIKIPKDKKDTLLKVGDALTSNDPQAAMQKISLQQVAQDISLMSNSQIRAMGLPSVVKQTLNDMGYGSYASQVQQAMQDNPQTAKSILAAIASEDPNAVARALSASSLGGSLSQGQIQSFARDAVNIYERNPNSLINSLPASTQQEIKDNLAYFCGVTSPCPSDASYTGFVDTSDTTAPVAPTGQEFVGQLAQQPIPVTQGGRVDQVSFYAHAVEAARAAGLDGYQDPTLVSLGLLNTGSAEEWGRLYTMMAKAESNFDINSRGPGGECSFGVLQFCPGEYGLGNMNDVLNPESQINAVINVTKSGNLFRYFSTLQHPERTARYANWFDQTVAPKVNGDVPYTPISYTGYQPGNGYWAGVSARGAESWMSPGSIYGPVNSGIAGLLSPLSGLMRSVAGTGITAPTAPPQPPPAPPATSPGTPTQSAPVYPVLTLIANPSGHIAKGSSLFVAWAATGVSPAQPCKFSENKGSTGLLRAQGNSGSFVTTIDDSYGQGSIVYTLACTPQDSRVAASATQKQLTISVF